MRSRRRGHGTAATARSEALRILRSNLLVAIHDLESPIVIVTSAVPGEGKTATCAELAMSISQSGMRVVLVDLDLRKPDAHHWVGAHNRRGVAEVLRQECSLDDALQYIDTSDSQERPSGLYFLATGDAEGAPSELLGTARMRKVLEALAGQADIVLLDTPPVLPVADTLIIGRMVAGALLVIESRSTPLNSVIKARDALARNQTRLLGVALNKLAERDLLSDFGYGYGYGEAAAEAAAPASPLADRLPAS